MAATPKDLEDKFDRLENRLKATFLEIEKRFESFKTEEPFVLSIETRLQELEDLLLLLQLEVTKIRERTGEFEFGTTPKLPDVEERLRKLETAAGEKTHENIDSISAPAPNKDVIEKIEKLESRIDELSSSGKQIKVPASINKELDVIEKRLERLEHERLAKAVKAGIIDKGILDDVKDILYS